jgi:hypothetical protein
MFKLVLTGSLQYQERKTLTPENMNVLPQTKLEQAVPLSIWKLDVCVVIMREIYLLAISVVITVICVCQCACVYVFTNLAYLFKVNRRP